MILSIRVSPEGAVAVRDQWPDRSRPWQLVKVPPHYPRYLTSTLAEQDVAGWTVYVPQHAEEVAS